MAIEAPQGGLNPTNCYDLYCAQVDQAMFTGLFQFNTTDGKMVPAPSSLTKSVTASNAGKTYTIEINPGYKFTNGEAVTAKTFVDTFNFTANGGNGQQLGFIFGPTQLNVTGYKAVEAASSKTGTMSGLKATGENTLEFNLDTPLIESLFENFLAGPQVYPIPSSGIKDIEAYNKNVIGNGPYKLQGTWDNAKGGTLVKNADYPGTAGKADTINMKIYASDDAMWADLQANTLDVTANLTQNALSTAPQVLGNRFINDEGGLQYSYYGFPASDPAFKEKGVRVAIAKSINTDEINQKLYYGTRQAGTSFAPSTINGGGTDICGDNCKFDAAAAKSMLQAAGGFKGTGVHISQLANETGDVQKALCNQIQANLAIKCVVDIYKDFGTMLDDQQKGKVPPGTLVGSGWVADNPTIQNMVTASFTTGNQNNIVGYANPQFDKLLQEGTQSTDDATQISKWQEAEKILLQNDFPAWPFQFRNQVGGYSTKVSNVSINPGGFVDLATITVNQ